MTQTALLDSLESELRQSLEMVRSQIASYDLSALQFRTSPERWNALECFAHLNAYLERYIPRMELAVHKAKAREWKPVEVVKYTGVAKRYIRRANPENIKTYKTPKHYNFWQKTTGKAALKGFIINSERLLRVIQAAREVNLNKAKVGRGKSGFFTLNLGNTLEWQVMHIRRHLAQIETQIAQMQGRGLV
ncbi:MAG TPA: DinB family protein [Saprospiraceae bacterium]|nr:DinB family protein [Saprospiraceae bacterium]HPI06660.1 DinB family protein [Saprospiraceae bacterium]